MSRKDVIVGIDAGTSVTKVVAFDLDGNELAAVGRPNRYEELPGGGVEQDMARTWADTVAVLRELAEAVPGLRERAAALAVTGQGDGTWLYDEAGEPTAPAWLWLDSRAAGIVRELDRNGVRALAYRHTGCGMNACNQSAQLLWLKRHAPHVLARSATACHCKDWLYFKLTGQRVTDVSEAIFTFGDFRTRTYAPEILTAMGLEAERRLLPEPIDGTRTTHPLSAAASAATGLPAGLPVALGFVDVVCTALGGGIYEPGRAIGCSIVGSTGMHMRFLPDVAEVRLGREPAGYTMQFPVPGSVAQMHSNMAATLNIDWVVDLARQAAGLLGQEVDRRAALATLDARVLDAKPAATLYHPYIHEAGERGPFLDAAARASFTGLSTRVGFTDLVRSVYEGLAFAARDCYSAMGHVPEEVRVAGGAARSKALKTILASVLGAPLRESHRQEAGAAGAAMMAAVAVGVFPDMAAAASRWVTPLLGDLVRPEPELARLYDRLFPLYVATRTAMPPLWAELASLKNGDAR
ncbi:FGGY family carbohydrate kinase [Benzoatithermus flavus]|uniref:FGGY-family carbohydrate kinase n=1 Tax=Benzoatithermus flavus TaxID=3108223 RepID=A0ABU8XK61_9PROT